MIIFFNIFGDILEEDDFGRFGGMNYHDWGMIYFRGIGTACGKKNINALEVQQDADEFSYKMFIF